MMFMIVNFFPTAIYAADYCFTETFDSYPTNTKPTVGTFMGDIIRVNEYKPGSDKALLLICKKNGTSASYKVANVDEIYTVSYSIMFKEDKTNGTVVIKDAQNKSVNIMSFSKSGIILRDGKRLNQISTDKMHDITFSICKQIISISIDGKVVLEKWYLGSLAPSGLSTLTFNFNATDDEPKEVLLDNICVVNGIHDYVEIPKSEYNPNVVQISEDKQDGDTEFKPQSAEIKPGKDVLLDKDFEEVETQKSGYYLFSPKSNSLEFVQDRRTGNHFLEYSKIGTDDGLFQFNFGTQKSDARYFVVEADIKIEGVNPACDFIFYDADKGFYGLSINNNGDMSINGISIGSISKEKSWSHVALALDYVEHKINAYVDGINVGKSISFNDINQQYLKMWRVYLQNNGSGKILFDNLRVYEGIEPREDIYAEQYESNSDMSAVPPILPDDSKTKEKMKDCLAISYYANTYFTNGEKRKFINPPYEKNGVLYVPIEELADGLGATVDWNNTVERVVINDSIKYIIGEDTINIDKETYKLDNMPEKVNDTIYFPIRLFAEKILHRTVTWDERKLVFVSNGPFGDEQSYMDSHITTHTNYYTLFWDISDYLVYDEVNKAQMLKSFETYGSQHPRIIINSEGVDRMKNTYANDDVYKKWADDLINKAAAEADKHQPTDFSQRNIEGNYLAVARQILYRLQRYGIAYFLTEDQKYADAAWEELYSVGSFDYNLSSNFLEMAEFQEAFAIGYDWFYSFWNEEQKTFIEDKIIKNFYDKVETTYTTGNSGGELGILNNRSIVSATGVSMTAMALFEKDPERFGDILWRTQKNIRLINRLWYPDGAWIEGGAYWEYTCQNEMFMMTSLKNTFGTDFGLSKAIGFNRAPDFIMAIDMAKASNSYSDVGGDTYTTSSLFSWFGRWFDVPSYTDSRRWHIDYYKAEPSSYDILFCDMDVPYNGYPSYPLDLYLRDSELVTLRSDYTKEATCVSFHGGAGERPHGHYDIGTFCLDMLGERWAYDYGAESYGMASEGDLAYRKRPEGHNCLVINPDYSVGQSMDWRDFAKVEKVVSKPRGAFSILDMTQIYKNYAKSVRRGYMLANDRRSVTVRDEIILSKRSEVYWFLQTKANVEIINDTTAMLSLNGKKLKVEFVSSARDAKFSLGEPVSLPTSPKAFSQQTVNIGFKKLMITYSGTGSEFLEVRFISIDDPAFESDMMSSELDSWNVPDGEIEALPVVTNIFVDGVLIEGFDEKIINYTLRIPDDQKLPPHITATAEQGFSVEVINPSSTKETTVVKVSDLSDPYRYKKYLISYIFVPRPIDPTLYQKYPIKKVVASAEPQPENIARNAIDGILSTRWSAQNECYIQLELESIKNIEKVGMATMNGSKRSLIFNIEVSENGKDWDRVYDGMTSGTTEDYEYYTVSGAKGKYVRINCFGTTQGEWNSIVEIEILGDK